MCNKQVDRFFQLFEDDVTDKVSMDMPMTKAKLLMESMIMFSERGYDGISVRDISDAVGIQTSSLYNHFKCKQELLEVAIELSSNLYYLYLNCVMEKYNKAVTLIDMLDAVVQDPKKAFNATSCYALSLVHCEKYRNPRSAKVYANIFIDHSVQFYRNIFLDLVARGACSDFDTKTAAIIVNNAFHTAISLSMQDYLGFRHEPDFSEMVYGIKELILKQVYPGGKISDFDEKEAPRLPPFPKEMMNFQKTGEAMDSAQGQDLEKMMSHFSPELGQVFSDHLDSYLKLIKADCGELTNFQIGNESQTVIQFLKENYLESVASQATNLEQAMLITKAMEAHAENWTKLKESIQKKIKNAEIKIQDIFAVFLTIEKEYERVYKRHYEYSLTNSRPAEVSARLVESLQASMKTVFGLLEKADPGRPAVGEQALETVSLVASERDPAELKSRPSPGGPSDKELVYGAQILSSKKVELAIDSLLNDMMVNQAMTRGKGDKMLENLTPEKDGKGLEVREPGSGFFSQRKSYGNGSLKRTDHKNLDVFVKVNGKIVKRPEPRLEPIQPMPTMPKDERREPDSQATRSLAPKAELDDLPLKSEIWSAAEVMCKNKTRS
ncbi:MAG: TetR/AcrR family transcriptional regulator [Deltaproteobacteria bacterium]|jgi:AcrR family transcriptional regulator|nr:TetR/AcrR family transcriptional regulator [Deltaproteobacteria bacterium]